MITQTEEWRPIKGYENYMVSSLGRIKSLNFGKEKILKIRYASKHRQNYPTVRLCKNGKVTELKIHRLVGKTFLPNPNNLPMINHKDEDRTNNCVENLEWCDNKYNCNWGTRNKRIQEKRGFKVICLNDNTIYPSINKLSRTLNLRPFYVWEQLQNNQIFNYNNKQYQLA